MRTFLFVAATVVTVVVVFVTRGPAAPTSPAFVQKPAQWEYSGLRYTETATSETHVAWTRAGQEVVGKDWEALGDSLKAPAPKVDSAQGHRQRVLDHLSRAGWEVLLHESDTSSAGRSEGWMLSRKLP